MYKTLIQELKIYLWKWTMTSVRNPTSLWMDNKNTNQDLERKMNKKRWENNKNGLETQTATKKAYSIKTMCLGKGKLNKWKKKKTVQNIAE